MLRVERKLLEVADALELNTSLTSLRISYSDAFGGGHRNALGGKAWRALAAAVEPNRPYSTHGACTI